jgi:hypothetical protein
MNLQNNNTLADHKSVCQINSKTNAFSLAQALASPPGESQFERLRKLLLISIYLQWIGYRFDNLCPIHGGHSGTSFKFDDQRGRWSCWVCHMNGDVVELHWYRRNKEMPVHKQISRKEIRDELLALWGKGEFAKFKPIAYNTALLPPKHSVTGSVTTFYSEVKKNYVDLRQLHEKVKEQLPLDDIERIDKENRHITYDRLLARCKIPSRKPVELLPLLFPGDPCLVIGKYIEVTRVLALRQYRKPSCLSFITPNSFREGGKRCRLDVVKRLYVIVEFDCFKDYSDGLDKQCRLIWHLAQEPVFDSGRSRSRSSRRRRADDDDGDRLMPWLALMLFSGGKSIHGWFDVRGWSEWQVYAFMRKAVLLGADPAPYKPEQPVRLPEGFNYTAKNGWGKLGRRQKVIYWNPQLNLQRMQNGNVSLTRYLQSR